MDYSHRYNALNKAQQQAVDTIEGPVMVIAGPGTGKTELLSVRTANILQKTDTLPENILCLTFTDSGAQAMRERLVGLLGKDAYKVAIHTFHSFGSEIINHYSDFFYSGAQFRPADELTRHQIISGIFDELGHSNVLHTKMNGSYTFLNDSLLVISELKRSGLTSDELLEILDVNDVVIEKTEQLLSPIFANKPHKKTAELLFAHIDTIRKSRGDVRLSTITPLADIIADSLQTAVDTAMTSGKTTAVTAWRNAWFEKNSANEFTLKSSSRQIRLRALSSIYEQYLARMSEAELYDFDDMILRVVHAMEIFDELRFNLQEKYQYVMVDEFQDTNMAQMRIVHNLTNNITQGDTPNIMVVGDDDQAIYSFQGADISNIINFRNNYPKARVITLTDNYRSGQTILSHSRNIIVQGSDRLENLINELDKNLFAKTKNGPGSIALYQATSIADERHWLVDEIQAMIASGTHLSDIAVLTRKHQEIERLLPYFVRANIPVQYERRDNVLELAPIILIEQLAKVLIAIQQSNHMLANTLLPEILSHPAWSIPPIEIWKLSLKSYKEHTHWLEEMAITPVFQSLHDWLITTAVLIPHTPLENMLDIIIGNPTLVTPDDTHDSDEDNSIPSVPLQTFISPLYEYFFSKTDLEKHSEQYVQYIEALRAVRTKLRQYQPQQAPTLTTFIEFITLHKSIGSGITSIRPASTQIDAVQIMTAHKSKGLEFDTVFIIGAIDSTWGERVRTRSRMIGYPENLQLAPTGDTPDERLRLFYVAATRAKNDLRISYSLSDDKNSSTARAGFLLGDTWQPQIINDHHTITESLETAEITWYDNLNPTQHSDLKQLLAPQLEKYQLSVTHLTNFLDVTRGGPQNFLLQNLLRFPQAMSPASSYGSAVHKTLQQAHAHVSATGEHQAIEDILQHYETALTEQRLPTHDFDYYLAKGSEDLQTFLDARYDSFSSSQKSELNFSSHHVMIGDAHVSGALDLIDIHPDKTITVTDYKTGTAPHSWTGKADYEKAKLHKYKQQLMFYKLLVENARDYQKYTVEQGTLQFIEPTSRGDIVSLDMNYNNDDQMRFQLLVNAVWHHIITLNLPDISSYDQSSKGILAFEQDLIDGTI